MLADVESSLSPLYEGCKQNRENWEKIQEEHDKLSKSLFHVTEERLQILQSMRKRFYLVYYPVSFFVFMCICFYCQTVYIIAFALIFHVSYVRDCVNCRH
jgi:hypothetical protein